MALESVTEKQKAQARKLLENTKESYGEIGEKVGISAAMVKLIAVQMGSKYERRRGRPSGTEMPEGWGYGRGGGRPAGSLTSPTREKAFSLFAEGKKPPEIYKQLGISKARAYVFWADYRTLVGDDKNNIK